MRQTRQRLWCNPAASNGAEACGSIRHPYLHPKKRYLKFKPNNGQCKLCPWHMKYLHYGGSATAFGGKADIRKRGGDVR
jgi:hypothetical protein